MKERTVLERMLLPWMRKMIHPTFMFPDGSERDDTTTSSRIIAAISEVFGVDISHDQCVGLMNSMGFVPIAQTFDNLNMTNIYMFHCHFGSLTDTAATETAVVEPTNETAVSSTKEKKRVFIAQPMDGIDDDEIIKSRKLITKYVENLFPDNLIEVVDQFHIPPAELPSSDLKNPRINMLGRSIRFLADVDLVIFYGDFLHSKGCNVELVVCKEYNIPFIHISEDKISKSDSNRKWRTISTKNGKVRIKI